MVACVYKRFAVSERERQSAFEALLMLASDSWDEFGVIKKRLPWLHVDAGRSRAMSIWPCDMIPVSGNNRDISVSELQACLSV